MKSPRASGSAPLYNLALNDALLTAFGDAWNNFKCDHGREPDPDIIMFRGAFTTTTVVFEIIEEP